MRLDTQHMKKISLSTTSLLPVIILFVIINGLVCYNAIMHNPHVGYDSKGYSLYIMSLSDFTLPTKGQTHEFFSPPLPFIVPAIVYRFCFFYHDFFDMDIWQCFFWGLKFAQYQNVLFSLGVTFLLVLLCERIKPGKHALKFLSLLTLGMLPVYYKTFAFVRGEPCLLFFVMVAVWLTIKVIEEARYCFIWAVFLGLSLGCVILSRQWGAFVLGSVFLAFIGPFYYEKQNRRRIASFLSYVFVVLFVASSWFYISLYRDHGTITAFNKNRLPFAFKNQPPSFYGGLGFPDIFMNPVRPAFNNQAIPTFYSEIWGDYWCYFIQPDDWRKVFGEHIKDKREYLGRVNLISLFPTALMVFCFFYGLYDLIILPCQKNKKADILSTSYMLSYLIVIISMVGYFWFLVTTPTGTKGDTVKATYMIQIFPFLSLTTGLLLNKIKESKTIYYTLLLLLMLIYVHNFPAMLTSYTEKLIISF
ncbi:ArnT family glycosyltransferase [candidate division CSSED10-310 bacterium]|uniref:ArnT family glycosyltransferase n=1 Tax=candidate division CSSED10-310 bacterium TaxID=2855610 RepID=A0ABV6YRM0_UNCC1